MAQKRKSKGEDPQDGRRNGIVVYVLLLTVAFSFRAAIARFYPNDGPDDGRVYAQIARNLLEQHVYSHENEPPYAPSLIRLPGYPLFLAGGYSIFGHGDSDAPQSPRLLWQPFARSPPSMSPPSSLKH